jgi:mannitol-1-phosphate 5-dehydrogenase
MALNGSKTFVGFGFGAIQAGLFLYEAYGSGAFGRLVVAEVVPEIVAALRGAGGIFGINIAHADGIERAQVGSVMLENPAETPDRERLIAAIAEADEIATAVPSVAYYASDNPGSLHRVLAAGLRRKAADGGARCIVYTAENNNHAAESLQAQVMAEIPPEEHVAVLGRVRFLNTVIAKMSGVVGDSNEIVERGLIPLTPGSTRTFLVEAFNRILISQVDFPHPFQRGIAVFEEKSELLPFEEAKLYGHNATHALLAYLAMQRGVDYVSDLSALPDMIDFARAAFMQESGAPLIEKYGGLDGLFTKRGYAAYVEDLLVRMTNPYLRDTAERVGRDPVRKLGWDDRLIGVMRLALAHNTRPMRYALGAAAALTLLEKQESSGELIGAALRERLLTLWGESAPPGEEREEVLKLVGAARIYLRSWALAGYPPLEQWYMAETP